MPSYMGEQPKNTETPTELTAIQQSDRATSTALRHEPVWGQEGEPNNQYPHFRWPTEPARKARLYRELEGATYLATTEHAPIFEIYADILAAFEARGSLDVITDIALVVQDAYSEDGYYKIPEYLIQAEAHRDAVRQEYCHIITLKYCYRLMKILEMGEPIHTAL